MHRPWIISPVRKVIAGRGMSTEKEREGEREDRRALHRARYPRREVVRCGRYIYSGL